MCGPFECSFAFIPHLKRWEHYKKLFLLKFQLLFVKMMLDFWLAKLRHKGSGGARGCDLVIWVLNKLSRTQLCSVSPVGGTLLSGITRRTVHEHDEKAGTDGDVQGKPGVAVGYRRRWSCPCRAVGTGCWWITGNWEPPGDNPGWRKQVFRGATRPKGVYR